MKTKQPGIQRSSERAFADHGWLKAFHSFSFANFYDPNNLHWGALRVFNEDRIAPQQGFAIHPHRDMEILTYVLAGELTHQDSMGNRGVVHPGGIQYVSAGTGIQHSEENLHATESCHLVQMWVLPRAMNLQPNYGQANFEVEQRHNRWFIAASGRRALPAPIVIQQDASLALARLEDAELPLRVEAERYGFLFVADGSIAIINEMGSNDELEQGDALRFKGEARFTLRGTGELVFWDLPHAALR